MIHEIQACPGTGMHLELSPLPSSASLPGSLGGLPRQAEGSEGGTIRPRSIVRTADGRTFKVQRISKRGVVTLVNTFGGFARYSHLSALVLA